MATKINIEVNTYNSIMDIETKLILLDETVFTRFEVTRELDPVTLEFLDGELLRDYSDVIRVNYN